MGMLNKTTDEINTNLDWVIGKESDKGIKIDVDTPTYPWHDLIGLIIPNTDGAASNRPKRNDFKDGVGGYSYNDNDIMDMVYHIPHDWLPNSDSFQHVHLAHNGTAISGTIKIRIKTMYSSRDGSTVFPVSTILKDIELDTVDVATTPQYKHIVLEVPLTTDGGSDDGGVPGAGGTIDSNLIEVDGLFVTTMQVLNDANITGGNLFIFTADVHYQSTGVGTKNSAFPFYG